MKQSQYYIPTLKDISSEVQMPSYQLMLRSGLVRNLAAGVFSWLPMGYKSLKKAMEVIREEMDGIGGQEFHLPALNPIDIWEKTNRVEAMGDVMFHIKNRDGLVLAPTHEEVIAFHAKQHVKSYKDMPMIWYQIQSKFRNEARPRSGVMRGRQFFMKDSYSLDTSYEALDFSYEKHYQAYKRIFDRCDIKYFIVGASSGAMGGSKSQEFMVENEFGEDICAISDSGYAANLEVASSNIPIVGRIESNEQIEEFDTPDAKTINDLIEQFNLPEERCAKSLVYIINNQACLILMRGNDELNEDKLISIFKTNDFHPASDDELLAITGANAGSIGPVNLKTNLKIYADNLLKESNGLYGGANINGKHLKNIDLARDVKIESYSDFRTVQKGEPCPINGSPIRIVKAIELGHIFKLGTKYSSALEAKFLDENGKEQPIVMGSYGIGVERILACYIEQHHDEKGIVWQGELSPFDVHLIGLNVHKSEEVKDACNKIYSDFKKLGIDVLFDDRKAQPGFKFNDADLIGLPVQIIVGAKNLKEGNIEIKIKRSSERFNISLSEINNNVKEYINV